MTLDEMNALRPGDKVRWNVKGTTYGGKVVHVRLFEFVKIKWEGESATDDLPINTDNSRYLERP